MFQHHYRLLGVSGWKLTAGGGENTVSGLPLWGKPHREKDDRRSRESISDHFFLHHGNFTQSPPDPPSPCQWYWAGLVQIIVLGINKLTVWQGPGAPICQFGVLLAASRSAVALKWMFPPHSQWPQIVHRWHSSLANCNDAAPTSPRPADSDLTC